MRQTITLDTQSHGVTYAKGFEAIGIQAGLKKSGKHDLALIYTKQKAAVAGTFTQNKVPPLRSMCQKKQWPPARRTPSFQTPAAPMPAPVRKA